MNIIGRLTRDAKVSTLQGEKKVVNFSVAVNGSYRNKQGERVEQTAYFDCAYWLTVKVADFLTKGTLVELTGRPSARAWVDRDGNPRAALNFHTSNIKLHDSSAQQAAGNRTEKQDDDLPF